MKHFEDLWEEAGGGICGKRACEKYYREALLWVKRECIYTEEDGHKCIDGIMIDKELEKKEYKI